MDLALRTAPRPFPQSNGIRKKRLHLEPKRNFGRYDKARAHQTDKTRRNQKAERQPKTEQGHKSCGHFRRRYFVY